MSGVVLLLVNFAALLAVIMLLWAYAVRIHDVSFIDAFWAFGMVILAAVSWWQVDAVNARSHLLLALVILWGIRLSVHLFVRWRSHGEDPRYTKIIGSAMSKNGWSWAKTALLMVFMLQLPLLYITCLPAQIGIWASEGSAAPFGWLAGGGAALALAGILFETIGDAQLGRFRANAANKGKVLDTGLWRYTRHPNYFGDACTWWGIWLVAIDGGHWASFASVIGPVFLTFTLTRWSGAALLERGMKKTRPDYADYIARTSGFVPWPPKRRNAAQD